jgi:hypothetical protein
MVLFEMNSALALASSGMSTAVGICPATVTVPPNEAGPKA